MRDGIFSRPLPSDFPYAETINQLCAQLDCSPALVGAIKINETGLGQGGVTNNVVSEDGGHGIMQLTSSYPSDWNVPESNISWAIRQFILQAWQVWTVGVSDINDGKGFDLQGEDLVRAIAASYNGGIGGAIEGHVNEGSVDAYTTNNYGARALAHYQAIVDDRWREEA